MKLVSTLTVLLVLCTSTMAFIVNPFTNTYRGGASSTAVSYSGSAFPNFTSANVTAAPAPAPVVASAPVVAAPQISTTTTTTQVTQQPQVSAAHSHPTPSFGPAPTVAPVSGHTHGPQVALPPVPVPGTPHLHSGHPYIAPAVAPQRMTYQQIVEYLMNSNGANLSGVLGNVSGNFLAQCKSYCDILPPNPTCDSSNTLYRNECEAKCIHKTVSTSTLRYGMCCCSDEDFNYETEDSLYFSEPTGSNLCISTCIFNCLGQETPIENEHSDDTVAAELKRSDDTCANID